MRTLLAIPSHPRRAVGFASTASTASTPGTNRLNLVEEAGYLVEARGSRVEAKLSRGVRLRLLSGSSAWSKRRIVCLPSLSVTRPHLLKGSKPTRLNLPAAGRICVSCPATFPRSATSGRKRVPRERTGLRRFNTNGNARAGGPQSLGATSRPGQNGPEKPVARIRGLDPSPRSRHLDSHALVATRERRPQRHQRSPTPPITGAVPCSAGSARPSGPPLPASASQTEAGASPLGAPSCV